MFRKQISLWKTLTKKKKKLEGSFVQHLGSEDMHWIHLAQEGGSHERRSELSEVFAMLNDYQIFKDFNGFYCSLVYK